jgi:hypothetical protein
MADQGGASCEVAKGVVTGENLRIGVFRQAVSSSSHLGDKIFHLAGENTYYSKTFMCSRKVISGRLEMQANNVFIGLPWLNLAFRMIISSIPNSRDLKRHPPTVP